MLEIPSSPKCLIKASNMSIVFASTSTPRLRCFICPRGPNRRLLSSPPSPPSPPSPSPDPFSSSVTTWRSSASSSMEAPTPAPAREMSPLGIDPVTAEEFASQSKLLKEFTSVPAIDKAWIFKSDDENTSRAMFSVGQANLLANKRKTMILSSHISKTGNDSADFKWSPFPVEMSGVSAIVPSPSGAKLLVVRNKDDSPTVLEIWGSAWLEKEIHVAQSVHGSIYADGWFEGISWNHDETMIAYVAEERPQPKPGFDYLGFKKECSEKDINIWKGQGDWEENWGETYSKKRKPSLFVIDIVRGEVQAVKGIPKSLSVGQVVWAPSPSKGSGLLVFVGWTSENGPQKTPRKLGIKYCYNRPCALYAIGNPFDEPNSSRLSDVGETDGITTVVNLTEGLTSACFPCFSPEGKYLVFLSAKNAVESGAHSATDSLHKMDWPADGKLLQSINITDVVKDLFLPNRKKIQSRDCLYEYSIPAKLLVGLVPAVMCPENDCFPGLYNINLISHPWLSDGSTMIISSVWHSTRALLSVNICSGKVSRISPAESKFSWDILALDGDHILAVHSSPIDPPQIKYGYHTLQMDRLASWNWLDVSTPTLIYSAKVRSLLSSLKFSILKIPVSAPSEELPKGAQNPFEAIFVSHSNSTSKESSGNSHVDGVINPLIVVLHGGPHSVSLTSYSKSLAFLSSLGYNLLIVNYRGSLGFGEEALQSLPGKIGSQDVGDVLAAIDYVIDKGLARPSKIAVLGGSHGGFLTTHLIGQAPERFAVACARNPVCNLSLMIGTTDIPDWCYTETYGKEGKNYFSEAPLMEHLNIFYNKSPISHLPKVKAPTLFLLGAQDLRVPVSNGLQYARALREKGVEVKIIVFPEDVHGLERPQSDFESFLNIGVWFNKYLKN